jgi:molybdenum cofactor cytidylyltransferase
MKFGLCAVDGLVGAVLAHSHRLPHGRTFRKGHLVDEDDARALAEAGVTQLWAARLEPCEVAEDVAAGRAAQALAGPGITLSPPHTGRSNLLAHGAGVLRVERASIDALNVIDENLVIATLADGVRVAEGDVIASVKTIAFAVAEPTLTRWQELAERAAPVLAVAPFQPKRVGVIVTRLPGNHGGEARAVENLCARLVALGSPPRVIHTSDHALPELVADLGSLCSDQHALDLLLVLSASAIVDRRDVVPAAIVQAGGRIERLGMPVDPGNLLLLAQLGGARVIGVPGCARSLKPSGFDHVLERLCAGLPLDERTIAHWGVGGLLKDIPSRPAPRAAPPTRLHRQSGQSAAIILAAGRSTRMMGVNKLLTEVGGQELVARGVAAARASKVDEVIVVTGHQAERVRELLAGSDVRIVHNPDYREGLSSSLRAGLSVLGPAVQAALVCLGDMPLLKPAHLDALLDAFHAQDADTICVPVFDAQRGHPVLWPAAYFSELKRITGDVGGRSLLTVHAERVLQVRMQDEGVLTDVDTPDALQALTEARENPAT